MEIKNELFFTAVEEMLRESRSVQVRVRGNSMRPWLHDNRSIVVLAPCDGGSVQVGDVVLFHYHGHHILHRIVAEQQHAGARRFIIAGDGNYQKQEHAAEADIVARMTAYITASGHTVTCTSRRWRYQSALWRALPPLLRRCLLSLGWRLRWW